MEVRAKDLIFGIAGMSLLYGPFIGAIVQKHAILTKGQIIGGIVVVSVFLIINLSNDFLVLLWKRHKMFKRHFLVSQIIVLVASFIIPPPYAYIIAVPLMFYIGDLAIKSLEEL